MSKFNFLIYLNAFSDPSSSNAPSLSNFKWTRDMNGIPAQNPISEALSISPGDTKGIFSGTRTLNGDNTTNYSLTLKSLSSNTYRISWTSGTLPNFRLKRAIAGDATTQVTVTRNGPLTIFTVTGGTAMNFTSVQVGDMARIGSLFNVSNQGEFKILSKNTNSFTVENESGAAEGPITLTSDFANQVRIYSSNNVQKGDTLVIASGFSSVSFGSYQVTDVTDYYVEFYSTDVLPVESGIISSDLSIYYSAKSFLYVESDQKISIAINGSQNITVEPFIINDSVKPGVFMVHANIFALSIQNLNFSTPAQVFLVTLE